MECRRLALDLQTAPACGFRITSAFSSWFTAAKGARLLDSAVQPDVLKLKCRLQRPPRADRATALGDPATFHKRLKSICAYSASVRVRNATASPSSASNRSTHLCEQTQVDSEGRDHQSWSSPPPERMPVATVMPKQRCNHLSTSDRVRSPQQCRRTCCRDRDIVHKHQERAVSGLVGVSGQCMSPCAASSRIEKQGSGRCRRSC